MIDYEHPDVVINLSYRKIGKLLLEFDRVHQVAAIYEEVIDDLSLYVGASFRVFQRLASHPTIGPLKEAHRGSRGPLNSTVKIWFVKDLTRVEQLEIELTMLRQPLHNKKAGWDHFEPRSRTPAENPTNHRCILCRVK